ncbi:hypothetical protein E2C01_016985 [Portunus trituberculatus]|uniref:Uncharacterized protein n=1 Tax=Portunus trituberculatus TaxID=210409 RepID=A0A5B7DR76_PORTR|nr:hypothetical protein [Portunus trituberculatus]
MCTTRWRSPASVAVESDKNVKVTVHEMKDVANSCGDNGGWEAKAASVKYHNISGQKQDASNSIPASEPRHTKQSRQPTIPSSQHSQIPGTLLGLIKVAKAYVAIFVLLSVGRGFFFPRDHPASDIQLYSQKKYGKGHFISPLYHREFWSLCPSPQEP